MSADLLSGRTQIRAAMAQKSAPPPSAGIDAAAHVICRMGGHIPNIDNEQPGACDYHRKQAALVLEQADIATRDLLR